MITLYKDGGVKILDDESCLIPILKADGWAVDGEDERSALMAEAESLGIKVHHKAGVEKIRELIASARAE